MFIKNWFYIKKDAPGIQRNTISSIEDTYLNIVDVDSPNSGNIISVDNFAQILPPGPAGAQGVQGPAGVPGPVGPAGLNWQGAWTSGDSYVADDAVGYDGASWFCILATSGTTTPDLDTTHWALLASQGAEGIQGAQGPTGPQGPAGSIPNLEFNATNKTVWNNGQGNISSNVSFGDAALVSNTTGYENTALGSYALLNNSTGFRNTALGHDALYTNTNGDSNVAVGSLSLYSNTSGYNNVGVGHSALQNNSGGAHNTAVGQDSLSLNTGGTGNTTVGSVSLQNTTGSFNSALGYSASSGGFSNSVILGAEATATGNNQFVVGSSSYNAGAVTTETTTSSTKTWTVIINGVARKVLLA